MICQASDATLPKGTFEEGTFDADYVLGRQRPPPASAHQTNRKQTRHRLSEAHS
jgi:hypothetical protein